MDGIVPYEPTTPAERASVTTAIRRSRQRRCPAGPTLTAVPTLAFLPSTEGGVIGLMWSLWPSGDERQ
jgi:hypothetical protein